MVEDTPGAGQMHFLVKLSSYLLLQNGDGVGSVSLLSVKSFLFVQIVQSVCFPPRCLTLQQSTLRKADHGI